MLSQACENPEKPSVAILGGAKIVDKIKTIEKIFIQNTLRKTLKK